MVFSPIIDDFLSTVTVFHDDPLQFSERKNKGDKIVLRSRDEIV